MGDDQLETSPHPEDEQTVWGSPGDRRADEYAGVQDDAAGYRLAFLSRLMACNSS